MINTAGRKSEKTKTIDDKLVDHKVDLQPAELKQYKDKFLYYPTTVKPPPVVNMTNLSAEDYINSGKRTLKPQTSYYEPEILIKDPITNKFKFVKKTEAHKYDQV